MLNLVFVLLTSFEATVVQRSVTDVRDLLIEAIDAPDGSAHGILSGEIAGAITNAFGAEGPLQIDVTTLRRYPQPGCRRLNIAVSQDGVRIPGASAAEDRRIEFGLDYCRDGRPPAKRDGS